VARALIKDVLGKIQPFELRLQSLVLSQRAAIITADNPTQEIVRIREVVNNAVTSVPSLHTRVKAWGFNIPPIIHSTLLRFLAPPSDLRRFLAEFDEISAGPGLGTLRIQEVLLTEEVRPYMRGAGVLQRFPLIS
jgi:hypothetical protein